MEGIKKNRPKNFSQKNRLEIACQVLGKVRLEVFTTIGDVINYGLNLWLKWLM